MAGGKLYSFEEVSKHSGRKDCWLIIAGKVYDVTAFMEEHPGGDEVADAFGQEKLTLRRRRPRFRAGKDATTDFEDIGHSNSAKELMPQYCIGEVDAATVPAKRIYANSDAGTKNNAATTSGGAWGMLLRLAVPVLLLALALAMQSYGKAKAE
ncbi:hypothetical protein HU200_007332 [Digitaria exilis]|uniref:Cytochrome b5 heme-binding domain-containing protein n=1 Tax=Digitaria exilis TaxID=1010633 RepID=A0A835KUR9_9POAL|nr:hypothetical protein HU200_007332 [Digitaria exilis]